MNFRRVVKTVAKLVFPAALLLGGASVASATTITSTYTGTVKTALDSSGVFGTPGADLAGDDYKLVFKIDSAAGDYSTFDGTILDPDLSGDQIFGGISAALTINGHSYAFTGVGGPGGNFDIVAAKPGFGLIAQQFSYFSSPFNPLSQVGVSLSSTNPGAAFPTSVYTAFVLSSCAAPSCTANLFFDVPGGASGNFHGTLNFGSLSVVTTPIPATLPLLVSALGGLGFVGWRRQKLQAA